jgi:oxygen-independent coproporphyrinogen III oxidase
VDAHSMLPASPRLRSEGVESLRLSTTDSFDRFFASAELKAAPVTTAQALEECLFLGLRLNRGLALDSLRREYGDAVMRHEPAIRELVETGLLERQGEILGLTPRGRLLSNEVFEKFIQEPETAKEISTVDG